MENNNNNDNTNTMINGIHHVTAICSNPQKILLSLGINDPIVSKTEIENLIDYFKKLIVSN